MASIAAQRNDPPTDPPARIRRVTPTEQRAALALLLTGRAAPDAPAVDSFLQFAGEHHLRFDHFWAAYEAGRPVADCLLLPSAGRTAMVFVSPVGGPSDTACACQVVRAAAADVDPADTALLQALLEPGQFLEQRALTQAGFTRLATLRYMERKADAPPSPLDLPLDNLRVLHYRQDLRQAFADAIVQSYEQTLDCPALVGMRDIQDILAGHMATGRFDPELWFAFYQGDAPVAVMLLAESPQRQAFELVYLGVSRPFRDRGLAGRILRHGLGVMSQRAASRPHEPSRLCLAVDDQNTPAVRLYARLGFHPVACKVAMVCGLKA